MVSDALKREIKKLDRQWAGSLRDASDFLLEMEQKSSVRAQRSERAPSSFRGYRHLFYHPVSGKPYDVWEDKNAGVAGGVLALMKTLATGETVDIDGLCRLDDVVAEAGYIADSLHLLAQISPASSKKKAARHCFSTGRCQAGQCPCGYSDRVLRGAAHARSG